MPTTYYDWDELEDNIAAEHDEAGNLIAEYTHEPGFHGSLVSEHRGGQTLQHHYDAQGNSLALSDDSGNVVDTFGHTAFGELTERTGTTATPFQFGGEHGYYWDQETGEYLVRRRTLDPGPGRWLSVDPMPPEGQPKPFAYMENTSASQVNPFGLAPAEDTSLQFLRLLTPSLVAPSNSSDSGEDEMTPPAEAGACAVAPPFAITPPFAIALPAPTKPACELVRSPSAVRKDRLGNVTCKQVVAGVFLWLKQDTVTVNGVATFVNMCYGCIDHSCKTAKSPKKKCGLAPKAVPPDIRHECKCVGPNK